MFLYFIFKSFYTSSHKLIFYLINPVDYQMYT